MNKNDKNDKKNQNEKDKNYLKNNFNKNFDDEEYDDSYEDYDENYDDVDDIDDDVDNENDDDKIIDEYINDEDLKRTGENTNNFDLIYKLNTNKHRQEGKHQLKRDTIFKGKIEEKKVGEIESHINDDYYNDSALKIDIEYDAYTDDYLNQNSLTKDVYDILNKETNLDFNQNRRKPNRDTFNNYYNLLLKKLGFRYTRSEIFVELSYYFTDNIFNMFKLLDKKPATVIIKELIQKGYLKNIGNFDFL